MTAEKKARGQVRKTKDRNNIKRISLGVGRGGLRGGVEGSLSSISDNSWKI